MVERVPVEQDIPPVGPSPARTSPRFSVQSQRGWSAPRSPLPQVIRRGFLPSDSITQIAGGGRLRARRNAMDLPSGDSLARKYPGPAGRAGSSPVPPRTEIGLVVAVEEVDAQGVVVGTPRGPWSRGARTTREEDRPVSGPGEARSTHRPGSSGPRRSPRTTWAGRSSAPRCSAPPSRGGRHRRRPSHAPGLRRDDSRL